jgi:hypothetical protein
MYSIYNVYYILYNLIWDPKTTGLSNNYVIVENINTEGTFNKLKLIKSTFSYYLTLNMIP